MTQASIQRSSGGRPRNSELTDKVLSVAEGLFGTKGFSTVTMAEVAAVAGVGLDTIYRRWPSKLALLLDVVSLAVTQDVPIIDHGSVDADLIEAVTGLIRFAKSPAGRVFAAAIGEAAHDDVLAAQLAAAQGKRRELARSMVERGVARGELREGTDADILLDLLSGVVWQRAFVSGHVFAPDEATTMVRTVLAGFRTV